MGERTLKVLIAEDDRATRTVLRRTLERWGYEVSEAEDGERAWSLLLRGDVRILVTDWEMPSLDGPALCTRVRRSLQGDHVYILLLTCHADKTRVVEGLDAGADDFIPKPCDLAELRARLNVGKRQLALHDALRASNRELARLAATDPLTHVGNRRSFDDTIGRFHAFAASPPRPYGVVMADIDHFKLVNDTFGHAVGDRVIAGVAGVLQGALCEGAEVFRYGGEELVVVTPTSDAGALMDFAESLRQAVASLRTPRRGGPPVAVTVSLGAALYDGSEDLSWPSLVQRADAALYASKRAGRDRVTLWRDTASCPPRARREDVAA